MNIKRFLLSLILLLNITVLFGSNDTATYKYNVSAGYAQASVGEAGVDYYYKHIGFSYNLFKELSCGVYMGHYEEFFFLHSGSFYWGLTANVDILPIFLKRNNFRVNPYIPLNVGNMYHPRSGTVRWFEEYNFGGGLELFPLKRLSCYTEYSYGKVFSIRNHRWLFGVSFKF
jgi:hypothetical protein